MRQFTSESFYLNDEMRGKTGLTPAAGFALEAGQTGQAESLAPLADDLAWSVKPGGDDLIGEALGSQKDDLGPNTSQYGDRYNAAPRIPDAAVVTAPRTNSTCRRPVYPPCTSIWRFERF
jgi:hypothetical protein